MNISKVVSSIIWSLSGLSITNIAIYIMTENNIAGDAAPIVCFVIINFLICFSSAAIFSFNSVS